CDRDRRQHCFVSKLGEKECDPDGRQWAQGMLGACPFVADFIAIDRPDTEHDESDARDQLDPENRNHRPGCFTQRHGKEMHEQRCDKYTSEHDPGVVARRKRQSDQLGYVSHLCKEDEKCGDCEWCSHTICSTVPSFSNDKTFCFRRITWTDHFCDRQRAECAYSRLRFEWRPGCSPGSHSAVRARSRTEARCRVRDVRSHQTKD